MARRGTKPKPSKDKKLKGTFRKDRSLKDEVEFDVPGEYPKPPSILGDFGKAEWEKIIPQLSSRGILNETDLSPLMAYCKEMETYYKCKIEIDKDGFYQELVNEKGTPYIIQHPCVAIGNKALQNAIRIATEFGFTASSRTRIAMGKQKDVRPDKAKLMTLMNRNG